MRKARAPYKKKFALISWESGERDVIALNQIPKKSRIVGDSMKLTWVNAQTKEKVPSMATLLKIGGEFYLHNTIYNFLR